MNSTEMKLKVSQIKGKLSEKNYGNFAEKHRKTTRPETLTSDFSTLLDDLGDLIHEASNKFPNTQIDILFEEAKDLLNVRRRAVNNNDFETGKAILLQVVSIIEENLTVEENKGQLPLIPNPPSKKLLSNQSKMIFVSYYDEQILHEIKTVFGTLGELAPEMDNLQTTERKQSNNLDTVSSRIKDIRSCSSAIICLPPEPPDDPINRLAYLDLGACLAFFPEHRNLLIHEGNQLPDNLLGTVETFHYQGNLDFKTGMELARLILKVLH